MSISEKIKHFVSEDQLSEAINELLIKCNEEDKKLANQARLLKSRLKSWYELYRTGQSPPENIKNQIAYSLLLIADQLKSVDIKDIALPRIREEEIYFSAERKIHKFFLIAQGGLLILILALLLSLTIHSYKTIELQQQIFNLNIKSEKLNLYNELSELMGSRLFRMNKFISFYENPKDYASTKKEERLKVLWNEYLTTLDNWNSNLTRIENLLEYHYSVDLKEYFQKEIHKEFKKAYDTLLQDLQINDSLIFTSKSSIESEKYITPLSRNIEKLNTLMLKKI